MLLPAQNIGEVPMDDQIIIHCHKSSYYKNLIGQQMC